jgi:hypothetical protein
VVLRAQAGLRAPAALRGVAALAVLRVDSQALALREERVSSAPRAMLRTMRGWPARN